MSNPANQIDQTPDYRARVAFAVMAICMSLSFVFVKISLEGFTLVQAAGGRLVLGAIVLIPIAFWFGDGLPRKLWFWKWAVVLGLMNFAVPISLTTYGLLRLPSNVVGALYSLIPLATIALSSIFLGAKISRQKLLGLGIGFLGLLVITEPTKWVEATGPEHALPMLATLGAVACFASAAIAMRLMPKVHPVSMVGASALVASVFGMIPFLSVFEGDPPSVRAWIGLLGVSILSTAIAYSIRFYLIRRKGPVFLAPNAYVGIILVNVFGVTLLGDRITPAMMIAFPLILVGLYIARDSSGHMKQV
ncbi:DMT family transporter [Algirhabdus cladophorae]|uniref:DMT family transporter n=1 Tax=Algirhabdus cladophorae TaxID=3377108 RepID=UPI003B847897